MPDRKYLRLARYVGSSTLAAAVGALVLASIGIPLVESEAGWRHFILVFGIVMLLAPLLSLPRALTKERLLETQRELERLARTDPLTGLMNRRAFFEQAKRILASCGSAPIGLMMIDVDHFKAINDAHGHEFGDEALRGIAATIADTVGTAALPEAGEALVARLGGEEFAVLVAGFDEHAAMQLAEQIRGNVEWAFAHHDLPPAAVTVSVGVTARADGQNVDAALRAADAALYEAKRAGRNRVRFAGAASQAAPTLVPQLPVVSVRARKRAVDAA